MFNKDGLGEITEVIVYVNLLIALLAVVILYDRRDAEQDDAFMHQTWNKQVEQQLADFSLRLQRLEEKIEGFIHL